MLITERNKLGFCFCSVRVLRNWPSRKCVGKKSDWNRWIERRRL